MAPEGKAAADDQDELGFDERMGKLEVATTSAADIAYRRLVL